MTRPRVSATLSRTAASDLWRNTLSQIHTVFGRLVYLSSLRNPNGGHYEHHGLALVFGEEEARKALKESHKKVFSEWISFNLEQQKADLELYLSTLPQDRKTTLENWQNLEPYRNLWPKSATSVEKQLYLADLNAILQLLKNVYGVERPDPDS